MVYWRGSNSPNISSDLSRGAAAFAEKCIGNVSLALFPSQPGFTLHFCSFSKVFTYLLLKMLICLTTAYYCVEHSDICTQLFQMIFCKCICGVTFYFAVSELKKSLCGVSAISGKEVKSNYLNDFDRVGHIALSNH